MSQLILIFPSTYSPKNMTKRILILLQLFVLVHSFSEKSYGQMESALTQFMFNKQTINPAYAGMWGKSGFFSLVRKQWAGINQTPVTQVFSFYTPIRTERVGVGLNVTVDRFGQEKKRGLSGDYAYEVALSPQTKLRLGMKCSMMSFKNSLTSLQLYDNTYDPAFGEDLELNLLPNIGIGGILYHENYYFSLSFPVMLRYDPGNNMNNFNVEMSAQTVYLDAGYLFRFLPGNFLMFKPTVMIACNRMFPLRYDLGINGLFRERLWLGVLLRSGRAVSFLTQWLIERKIRLGLAVDMNYHELFPGWNGTYEVAVGIDLDFRNQRNARVRYF